MPNSSLLREPATKDKTQAALWGGRCTKDDMIGDLLAKSGSADRQDYHAQWMAAAFALYGLMAVSLLAINVPPFQVTDETSHFQRAAQVAQGDIIGTRFSDVGANGSPQVTAGGPLDPALIEAITPFNSVAFYPEVRATRRLWAPDIHWSDKLALQSFPTVNYPPFFYVPSAIGVLVGREAGLSVVETLTVSRLLTGLTAVALGAMAIAIAGGAAAWIFTILTLPMSLSLIASASQDAMHLGCSALAGALLMRALRWPSARNGTLITGLTVMLGLVAMARPAYGALATLPLAIIKMPWRWRILATAAVAACVTIWWTIVAATTLTEIGADVGADAATQLARLRDDPLLAASAMWGALTQYWPAYSMSFIGQLGWLDTTLPISYHIAAKTMLGMAALTAMLEIRGERISVGSRLVIAAGLLLSVTGIFVLLYLSWTTPGRPIVEGVQGRYFLPLALAGTALLPALGHSRLASLHRPLLIMVVMFPVVSLAVVMRAIVLRYYLG